MKNSKKNVNRLQNLALLVLTASALVLLLWLPLLKDGVTGKVQTILSTRPVGDRYQEAMDMASSFASVNLVITGDGEYGRCGRLYVSRDDPQLQQILPLFQEAVGSSGEISAAAGQTFQNGLGFPSLYLDMGTVLPRTVAAAWLGEDVDKVRDVRAMALTAEEETAVLYLVSREDEIFRGHTALPSQAILDQTENTAPNGCRFAFETNYGPLAPYTVLASELQPAPVMHAEIPHSYTAYNLLSALDFNPHTTFRYTEKSGVEVVEESPRTLRIGPDGTVSFSGGEEPSSPLYRVSSGERLTEVEALEAGARIASALTEGSGGSPLFLKAVEKEEDSFRVRFTYQAEGIPVYFTDEGDALEVLVTENAVTEFSYRCRRYTAAEEDSRLMSPDMAVAIASLRPGASLSVGYVDGGGDTMAAQWLAG